MKPELTGCKLCDTCVRVLHVLLLVVITPAAPLTRSFACRVLSVQTPTPLPDALRGEQYAFVTMPVSEFRQGNINDDNVGVGRWAIEAWDVGKLGGGDSLGPGRRQYRLFCFVAPALLPCLSLDPTCSRLGECCFYCLSPWFSGSQSLLAACLPMTAISFGVPTLRGVVVATPTYLPIHEHVEPS